jgi:hypothetical protein
MPSPSSVLWSAENPLQGSVSRVVNNQLSGAQRPQIELIDFLFKPSNCLYRFNPCFIWLAADFELRIELIVENSVRIAVEHEGYPETGRYPFPDFLPTTTDCCQMYFESSLFPYQPNEFGFEHAEMIEQCLHWITPAQLKVIKRLRLGLYMLGSDNNIQIFEMCSLGRFVGLETIVVDTKHRPSVFDGRPGSRDLFQTGFKEGMGRIMGRDIKIIIDTV